MALVTTGPISQARDKASVCMAETRIVGYLQLAIRSWLKYEQYCFFTVAVVPALATSPFLTVRGWRMQ